MTTPTTNYGWPKPATTDTAGIAGINTVLDAVDTSLNTVATTIAAEIKPMGMMKMIAKSFSMPTSPTTTYLTGTNSWEQQWFVNGTIDGSPTGTQPIVMNTDGTWKVTTPGVYRLVYNINLLTYSSTAEGYWFMGVYDPSAVIVPRSRCIVRLQTHHTSFQTLRNSVLLRATTGGDIAVDTLYKFGATHDQTLAGLYLITRYDQADPYFSYYTLEWVRGL